MQTTGNSLGVSTENTRALFDERGLQDAPIDEIARAVGIARGLVYRLFSSKEELYVLTVTDYLRELDGALSAAILPDGEPVAQLERWALTFAGFCERYPAFLPASVLLRFPTPAYLFPFSKISANRSVNRPANVSDRVAWSWG